MVRFILVERTTPGGEEGRRGASARFECMRGARLERRSGWTGTASCCCIGVLGRCRLPGPACRSCCAPPPHCWQLPACCTTHSAGVLTPPAACWRRSCCQQPSCRTDAHCCMSRAAAACCCQAEPAAAAWLTPLTGQDAAADGHIAGEGALLVDVVACFERNRGVTVSRCKSARGQLLYAALLRPASAPSDGALSSRRPLPVCRRCMAPALHPPALSCCCSATTAAVISPLPLLQRLRLI